MNPPIDIYNFEQFLRDSVDDFKMTPQRKIWYGIYNQMHPAKRWPSMAISLLILTCIMFVGISNNNNINNSIAQKNKINNNNNPQKINENTALLVATLLPKTPTVNSIQPIVNLPVNNSFNEGAKEIKRYTTANIKNSVANTNVINTNSQVAQNSSLIDGSLNAAMSKTTNKSTTEADIATLQNKNIVDNASIADNQKASFGNTIEDDNTIENTVQTSKIIAQNSIIPIKIEQENLLKTTLEKNVDKETKIDNVAEHVNNKKVTPSDILEKENYVKALSPAKKVKHNGSVVYYFAPSYGYRKISHKNNFLPNQLLKDAAALNLELGAALQYKLNKKVNLIIGLQANYTNYVSMVVDLGHTTPATLAVNNFAQSNLRTSTYATKIGADRLNKTTWQIAMPIGANIKIVGNDNFSWNVGATLQPTYVLGGTSYVLSADNQNYIAEKALLRKLSINTAAETFLNIKTAKGIHLLLGPQVRYQLLSTYKTTYNHTEKMYNFGFKVGVITKL